MTQRIYLNENVNMQGCYWIMDTVNQALTEGHEEIDLNGAMAAAEDAEHQMSLGNPPRFEIMSCAHCLDMGEFEVPAEY